MSDPEWLLVLLAIALRMCPLVESDRELGRIGDDGARLPVARRSSHRVTMLS
jgi:hypothetical protein